MLIDAIRYLMQRKYHAYKVYLHNFSKFDGVFLLKILVQFKDRIEPIINDGRLINITFYYNKYKLYFRDSFLILPSSLLNLSKQFNIDAGE